MASLENEFATAPPRVADPAERSEGVTRSCRWLKLAPMSEVIAPLPRRRQRDLQAGREFPAQSGRISRMMPPTRRNEIGGAALSRVTEIQAYGSAQAGDLVLGDGVSFSPRVRGFDITGQRAGAVLPLSPRDLPAGSSLAPLNRPLRPRFTSRFVARLRKARLPRRSWRCGSGSIGRSHPAGLAGRTFVACYAWRFSFRGKNHLRYRCQLRRPIRRNFAFSRALADAVAPAVALRPLIGPNLLLVFEQAVLVPLL
jgi:hypothetical protein